MTDEQKDLTSKPSEHLARIALEEEDFSEIFIDYLNKYSNRGGVPLSIAFCVTVEKLYKQEFGGDAYTNILGKIVRRDIAEEEARKTTPRPKL